MKERFSDDFYHIIYSEDEIELYEQCVQSYQPEDRLDFLKYLRSEFSTSNLNSLFDQFMEGISNLDENKMAQLRSKFERLEGLKIKINDSININSVEENQKKASDRAVQVPYKRDKQDLILEKLYKKLNGQFINTSLDNFKALFQSTYFQSTQWHGNDAQMKGLIELLTRKFNFDFGHHVNVEISKRFYKVQGKPYNVKSLGNTDFQNIIANDPENIIYSIIEEIINEIEE